jgi:hypothetical protein
MRLCQARGLAWIIHQRRARLRYQGQAQRQDLHPGRTMVTSPPRSSKILITHEGGQAVAADACSAEKRKSSCILMTRSLRTHRKKLRLQRSNNLSSLSRIYGRCLRPYKQRLHLSGRTLSLEYECSKNGWIVSIVRSRRQCSLRLCQKAITSIELRSRGIHQASRVMQGTRRTNRFHSHLLLLPSILKTMVHLLNRRL